MDHGEDGLYTSQKRLSRFVAQIATDNQEYTVRTQGTTPLKTRWTLRAESGGVQIKIPYNDALSVQVKVNNAIVEMTDWDQILGAPSPLTKTAGCGENRYVGVENYLEVYITAGCEVYVEPRDAIHAKVRMDWTLESFYADGGVTRFVDRLAAVLNIHSSRIRTVACYEGSVIVDFFISSEAQTSEDASSDDVNSEIDELQQEIIQIFNDGSADLGAPIMGVEGNDELLFGTAIPAGPQRAQGFGESTAIRI